MTTLKIGPGETVKLFLQFIGLIIFLTLFAVFLGKSIVWIVDEGVALKCIRSTQEMIVYQTGPLYPLLGVVGFIWFMFVIVADFTVLIFAISLIYSAIKQWHHERHLLHKNISIKASDIAFPLIILVFVSGCLAVPIYALWTHGGFNHPHSSEKIVIDTSRQCINMETHYLLKNEENLRISFEAIDNIKYHYYEGYEGFPSGIPERASVEIIRVDGTKFEIYRGNVKKAYNLAKAVAEATGKELIERKHLRRRRR